MDITSVANRLRQFEGSVPYMYKCSGGDVTVGVGHAIFSANAAAALHWANTTEATVRTDYAKVSAAAKGLISSLYAPLTMSRMLPGDIEKLLAADIDVFSGRLSQILPSLNQYPEPAQEALFDMAYNLGIAGLLKFHKMFAAIEARQWDAAAANSHRLGIGESRNIAIEQLFLRCKVL